MPEERERRPRSTQWRHGQKTEIARRAGISRQYLHAILKGERNPTVSVALRLERAAAHMGLYMPVHDILCPESTTNPLFEVL